CDSSTRPLASSSRAILRWNRVFLTALRNSSSAISSAVIRPPNSPARRGNTSRTSRMREAPSRSTPAPLAGSPTRTRRSGGSQAGPRTRRRALASDAAPTRGLGLVRSRSLHHLQPLLEPLQLLHLRLVDVGAVHGPHLRHDDLDVGHLLDHRLVRPRPIPFVPVDCRDQLGGLFLHHPHLLLEAEDADGAEDDRGGHWSASSRGR